MTESLLQNLEEKVISLLNELDTLRSELSHLKHENSSLKIEKANATQKLQGLISLVDAMDVGQMPVNVSDVSQGNGEYIRA